EMMGVVGPGSPGIYESGQLAQLKEDLEYVLTSAPRATLNNPKTAPVAEDRRGGAGVPQALGRQDLRHELRVLLRRGVRHRRHPGARDDARRSRRDRRGRAEDQTIRR